MKDLSDSREVMESKESPKISWFVYILFIFIILAIVFASIFEIDEYIKVNGEIKTLDASSSIISSSTCKLKKVCIEEGQSVNKGDILFILDVDYAKEQKEILENQLIDYKQNLSNTELLKRSIENNQNLFNNNLDSLSYYYRYEQYQNSVSLSIDEIENSQLSNELSFEEKQSNLKLTKENIEKNNKKIEEYKRLIDCVKSNNDFSSSNSQILATYLDYNSNYKKSLAISEQYKSTYNNLKNKYSEQVSKEDVTIAEQQMNYVSENILSYQETFLANLENQINLISEQITYIESLNIINNDNLAETSINDLYILLNEYIELRNAISQGYEYNSSIEKIQTLYDEYTYNYSTLYNEYDIKSSYYQEIYDKYMEQTSTGNITQDSLDIAKSNYDNSILDLEILKNNFISQIETNINSLDEEIKNLKNNQTSLELSIKGIEDLDEYKTNSIEKIKNDNIVSINNEINTLKDNISSIESQLVEIDNTISNSEIKATVDGTITLVNELNVGDTIQAGNSLCSLIPLNDDLKAILYIPENEISKIQTGQSTEYIFDAIPYNEYGKITGKIQSISKDSILNENTGEKYYLAQANLSTLSLTNHSGNIRQVKNGMLFEAKTISGSKKAIIWLFQKINLID